MAVCECCGEKIKDAALRDEIYNASRLLASALELLAENPGRIVNAYQISERIYQHKPDGGAENVSICVSQLFRRHSAVIKRCGLSVSTKKGHGGGYSLTLATVAA